jgi:hypothetical protein
MVSEARDSMAETNIPQAPTIEEQNSVIVVPATKDMVRVGLLGLAVGLITPFLAFVLQKFVVDPLFCRAGGLGVCSAGDLTTYYVATIIMAVVAVALMANWQIFRPLLVAVAAAASLWGFRRYTGDVIEHSGWEYFVASGVLYAAAYILFYWLLRLKNFALSVVLSVVAVVLLRWALLA